MAYVLRSVKLHCFAKCDTCGIQVEPRQVSMWTDPEGSHAAYDVPDEWIVLGPLEYCSEACFTGRAREEQG